MIVIRSVFGALLRVRRSVMINTQVSIRTKNLDGITQRAWQRFATRARVLLSQFEVERFETSTAPDGTPWTPLKSTTRGMALLAAVQKVGGREARAKVVKTATGGLKVVARRPQSGFQKSAIVRRTKSSKILVDTGRLRQSVVVNSATADAVRRTGRLILDWGTRVPYAGRHQHGDPARNLPARPFLGDHPQLIQRLRQELQRAIDDSTK